MHSTNNTLCAGFVSNASKMAKNIENIGGKSL